MLLRCLVLLFCLTAICAQKGGRLASASEPSQQSPSRIWAGRKIPQPSEPIQQVQEPEDERAPEEDREVPVAAIPQRPRPRPFLPPPQPDRQPAESDPGGHPAPEPYSFSYSVDDPESGAATSREETQDINGEIVGFYHMQDADGRMRRVDYTAGKDGFKANIRSNEEGLIARAPADVNIELNASPPVSRVAYTPNNRPAASESSLKRLSTPVSSQRIFQTLIPTAFAPQPLPAPSAPRPIPAPVAPAPLPAPPTQENQIESQRIEQRAEDPPEDSRISQQYETSEQSDPQEIVQQRNVDIEEAFESSPPQQQPPVKGLVAQQPQLVQIQRPIGQFTPSRIQSFREQGLVGLQNLEPQRITQVREEVPNIIEDPQPPASTKTIQRLSVSQQSYPAFRPIAPVINTPIQVSRPQPQVQPQFTQFFERAQVVQQTVPNLAPLSPPSNNIVLQQREHRQPISQERLLNYLHPISVHQQSWQQVPEVQIAPQPPRQPLQVSYPVYQPQQQIQTNNPFTGGYNIQIDHREDQLTRVPQQQQQQQQQQQERQIIQERIVEQPTVQIQPLQQIQSLPPPPPQPTYQTQYIQQQQVRELVPPPPQPTYQTQYIQEQQVRELVPPPPQPTYQTQYIQEQQVRELVPPPPQQPLPQINLQSNSYEFRPLPSLPQPQPQIQRQDQFEPQTYEPLQQTYEPLQQEAEDPAEESRVEPPCKCDEKASSSVQAPTKGESAPTEPQPVKSGRLSPARAFIPQAFRSSSA